MTEYTHEESPIIHEPSQEFIESTNVYEFMRAYGIDDYEELVRRTTEDVDGVDESGVEWFWDTLPEYLGIDFYEPYEMVRDDADGPQFSEWYPGGEINLAHNVVDRHAAAEARNSVACLFEGEPGDIREVTYDELHRQSNKVANYLGSVGVETGDTVGMYMPMVPEVISILYGCFKIGAIAVPIFSGFGVEATATRIEDSECSVLFTGDGSYRRGTALTLKLAADDAIAAAGHVEHTVVFERLGDDANVQMLERDEWWDDAIEDRNDEYGTKSLPSSQESMLLYSSGTTGKPKGIVLTHAGVQLQCAKEMYFGFDHKPSDRFFWVSDIGWMMGPWMLIGNHTFGGTVFMYEGAPDHPEPDRFWEMIDRHSLSTGEPWDPESWQWFYEHVGQSEAPIINISGGTEICGCFLMPMPTQPLKPASLGGPGLGMDIDIVDDSGNTIADSNERGFLVARDSCPSTTKSLWSGDERYIEEYWSTWEDLWDHGDFAQKDEDGYWFLHGRADDTLNVAGRKVGPAEIEGVLTKHEAVNQAAAVGVPDETTGTAVVTYVVLEGGYDGSDDLRGKLSALIGEDHGKPFRPREILFVSDFPKTQSGKVIRRAISSLYQGEELGDMSSIENPEVLEEIESAS